MNKTIFWSFTASNDPSKYLESCQFIETAHIAKLQWRKYRSSCMFKGFNLSDGSEEILFVKIQNHKTLHSLKTTKIDQIYDGSRSVTLVKVIKPS